MAAPIPRRGLDSPAKQLTVVYRTPPPPPPNGRRSPTIADNYEGERYASATKCRAGRVCCDSTGPSRRPDNWKRTYVLVQFVKRPGRLLRARNRQIRHAELSLLGLHTRAFRNHASGQEFNRIAGVHSIPSFQGSTREGRPRLFCQWKKPSLPEFICNIWDGVCVIPCLSLSDITADD